VWLITGMLINSLSYMIVPLTMVLMYRKRMYEELILGYLFILILSDSLTDSLFFAKNVKNIYISMLALFFILDPDSRTFLNRLYMIFLPFLIFSGITMAMSVNEPFFFTCLQKTVSYALTLIILPSIFTRLYLEHGALFFRRTIFFIITILLLGILLKFFLYSLTHLENGRYRGLFGSPNGLGTYSILAFIVFFIINDFFPELFIKRERLIIVTLILGSIILSGSRNAVISILIFYVFQRFFSSYPILGLLVFLSLLLLGEIINNNLVFILTALDLGQFFRVNTIEEGSGRLIAWEFAWRQIQHDFFIGKGFSYNEFYMRQHYGELSRLGHQGGIHNSFLTFWMDQGLVGLMIYLRSYILLFIKASKKTKYAYAILFAISFSAFFESWLVGSLSAFAFLGVFIFTIITTESITENDKVNLELATT
jgi:O-antigen ligase